MNERIWKVLQHRATQSTATAVLGFTAGAMFGYWRTKRQYNELITSIEKVAAENEQYQFDFKEAAIDAEVNRRVKAHVARMAEILGYDTTATDEEALISLREDHPAFDDNGVPRVITSARIRSVGLHTDGKGLPGTGILRVVREDDGTEVFPDQGEPIGTIDSVTQTEDGTIEITGTAGPEFEEVVTRTHNIFDQAGDEWDYKTEIENRDKTKPYVIHVDEYVNDEMGWDSQSTLTYFEADDILVDEHDTPIYKHADLVGELRFGHGSNDPNVVYIRNEQRQAEYEILRNPDSYELTVLGERADRDAQITELKHSSTPRFRPE